MFYQKNHIALSSIQTISICAWVVVYLTIFSQPVLSETKQPDNIIQARNGQQVCIYKGANNTFTLVVEGQCPNEYRCKYDPHGQEPNIDSVVDSLNDKFK